MRRLMLGGSRQGVEVSGRVRMFEPQDCSRFINEDINSKERRED